jgi:MFS family permease
MATNPHNTRQSTTALLAIMGVVFVAFLVIGMAMPVLPLHVHDRLGLGTFLVGLVSGSQFGASLISRPWAGHYADRHGAKRAVIVGLLVAAMSGLLYLASLHFLAAPFVSVAVLLLGRSLLGAAESVIITGAVLWGLSVVPPQSTGKVIAWMGAAMFGAFAVGAPIGAALYAAHGFAAKTRRHCADEAFARLGRCDAARRPREKPHAQARFERTQRVAQRRLRDAELRCGFRKATFAGDGEKRQDVVEVATVHS